jgi:hypothetical protein
MKKQNNLEKKIIENPRAIAILYCKSLAKEIIKKYPGIVEEYTKNSLTAREIAEKYMSEKIRGNGHTVHCAIHQALEDVLGKDQKQKISRERVSLRNRENGKKLYSDFLEFQKSKKNLDDSTKNRFGMFLLTPEQHKENSRKSVIASGNIPYDHIVKKTEYGDLNEEGYIIKLKESENLSWKKLTEKVNEIYKHNRKPDNVRFKYTRSKNRKLF